MILNPTFEEMIDSPVRAFMGRVEFYEGSTLALLCGCHDNLKQFSIERVGEKNKFFGQGICQKINVKLVDKDRKIHLSTANSVEVVFGKENDYIYAFPRFYITEVNRDEKTNELSITAYDALYKASKHTVSELVLSAPYTIAQFATACANLLGVPIALPEVAAFNIDYPLGANFDGTETIREALNAIAEATQTIYFIDWDWRLTFKRLDMDGAAALSIGKEKYFNLENKTNRRLATICHATELGDNVSASTAAAGTTQFVRDNPFWELRTDIDTLVNDALAAVGGFTINQFECSWRGNFLLEIGDKVALTTKDNEVVYSYVLDDVITFDGALKEVTQWAYEDNDNETESNPTSLGDALKQTYARVDKANREISLVASQTEANREEISNLIVNTDSIQAAVNQIESNTSDALGTINDEIDEIAKKVSATMSAEEVEILVSERITSGIDSVETSTGFTFNQDGLTISKSDSNISTRITEDGMSVHNDNKEVLTANNQGVKAIDLHATTYLIIGNNSRFEDMGEDRTACFWIGG